MAGDETLLDRVQSVLGPDHEDFRRLRYLLIVSHITAGRDDTALALLHRYPSPGDNDHFTWTKSVAELGHGDQHLAVDGP